MLYSIYRSCLLSVAIILVSTFVWRFLVAQHNELCRDNIVKNNFVHVTNIYAKLIIYCLQTSIFWFQINALWNIYFLSRTCTMYTLHVGIQSLYLYCITVWVLRNTSSSHKSIYANQHRSDKWYKNFWIINWITSNNS